MMGSNMKVLRQSIGPHVLERVKTCEFHFKDCRNRQARELREEDRSCFKLNYTIVFFETESPVSYNKAKKDNDRKFLHKGRMVASKKKR